MIPLVDEPKVVAWIKDGLILGLATNISPDTHFTLVDNELDFIDYAAGLSFSNSILDLKPAT